LASIFRGSPSQLSAEQYKDHKRNEIYAEREELSVCIKLWQEQVRGKKHPVPHPNQETRQTEEKNERLPQSQPYAPTPPVVFRDASRERGQRSGNVSMRETDAAQGASQVFCLGSRGKSGGR
jgi:hypothetical protein